MIVSNKPLKLTIGIIIGLIILFMGMKEVKAHSFPGGDTESSMKLMNFIL
ncbi:MAG: hypothetical protein ABL895_09305 [Cyclobacteriaceae bacterium]